ncbi:MAG TPA: membrane protein insertase YidC [Rhizomicrobium sp.]|nr:membrane protein insertase YidC [Rhizomicrobium sp.]
MNENRNITLAMVLSLAVLAGWYFFIAQPQMRAEQAKQAHQAELGHKKVQQPQAAPSQAPQANAATASHLSRPQALASGGARIAIDTPTVDGSILLKGARFDDLRLKNYHETVDKKSPEIVLFSPDRTPYPYFAEFGWTAGGGARVPTDSSQWKQTGGGALSPDHPVTLSWNNGEGLVFTRTISVDRDYMFTLDDSVANRSGKSVTLYPYALVVRVGLPNEKHYYSLHEGFIGKMQGSTRDPSYDAVKPGQPQSWHSTGGWLGITDKYWMATLIPPQNAAFDGTYQTGNSGGTQTYQADYRLAGMPVAPGASAHVDQRLFAGAKVVSILDTYRDKENVPAFEDAVDWGWYFFITKPMFSLLDFFHNYFGSMAIAIVLLTITIRLLFFPLAQTQFKSMTRMKKLQPQVESIKERFADDRVRQQQEMMDLYKREKVNPVSGCLPMLIQIPVFFSLYKVLLVTIEMRHAPFIGWIHDLSAPDPTTYFNLFGLLPWSAPDSLPGILSGLTFLLHVGVWPIIMGMTQWVQTKLNPASADPVQASMMNWMPVIFTFMLAAFPVGLVIYYAWSNTLSLAQQWYIMHSQGVEVHLFKNLSFGRAAARFAAPRTIEGKAKDVTNDPQGGKGKKRRADDDD